MLLSTGTQCWHGSWFVSTKLNLTSNLSLRLCSVQGSWPKLYTVVLTVVPWIHVQISETFNILPPTCHHQKGNRRECYTDTHLQKQFVKQSEVPSGFVFWDYDQKVPEVDLCLNLNDLTQEDIKAYYRGLMVSDGGLLVVSGALM